MSVEILYFGCIRQSGHHLHSKQNRSIRYHETPWGIKLDGGVTGFQKKDGWSAYGFADYSVDTRPGSNSIFLCAAEVSADELLTEAFNQWPEVWNRPNFPRAPHWCPTCRREWPKQASEKEEQK